MCGVVGIFTYKQNSPPVDRDDLRKMRDYMSSRGPDGKGEWFSGDSRVALGHRRLAIIDLSDQGAQPMLSSDGKLVISFNGEIYNYKELREKLEKKGYIFRSQSDTEVLLHLYQEKGMDMVQELRGMFALIIWDGRNKGVFVARDQFGIKPLYYSDDGNSVRIASQVKALLQCKNIDRSLEPAGQVGFFLWGHVPDPFTLYQNIRALPAGSTLWIGSDGKKSTNRYFNLKSEIQSIIASANSVSWNAETLREELLDTIQHHLISDVPVGVFLSSGLDSTTLAALSSEITSDVNTVTLGFSEYYGTQNDEAPLAEAVAKKYKTLHNTAYVDKEEFLSELDQILKRMDQPTIDGINSYYVSKVTASTGLKVAISGVGGDEIFAGYPSFRQIPVMTKMVSPINEMFPLGKFFRKTAGPILRRITSPKYAGLLEYGGSYGGAYLMRRGMYMPWEMNGLFGEEIAQTGLEKLHTNSVLDTDISSISDDRLKITTLELNWYMKNQLLRDIDWASMAHSLEVRVPFVDVKLFRAIVSGVAQKQLVTKKSMAMTTKSPLPAQILNRKKTGFSVPIREWAEKAMFESNVDRARGVRGWAKYIYQSTVGEPIK